MTKSAIEKTLLFCTAREEAVLRAINLMNLDLSNSILLGSSSHPISKKGKSNYLSWGDGFFNLLKGKEIKNSVKKENITKVIICLNGNNDSNYRDIKKFANSLCKNVKEITPAGEIRKADSTLEAGLKVTGIFLSLLAVFTPLFKIWLRKEMETDTDKREDKKPVTKVIRETNEKNEPAVSVVIRTYNEEKFLALALESLFSQKGVAFEVIIIDSHSTDRTVEIAKKFDARIFQIAKENFSYGGTLNLGASLSRGSIVVNLSAHAIPKDNFWLSNLICKLGENDIVAVHGREVPIEGHVGLFEEKILADAYGEFEIKRKNDFYFSNANSAIKKELLLEFPFDETLNWAEDQLWASKIQEKGYATLYNPTAVVYHSHNLSMKENFKRAYLYYEMLFSTLLKGKENEIDSTYRKSLPQRAVSFRRFLGKKKSMNFLFAFFYSAYCEYINYLGCKFAFTANAKKD